jgi:putative hydrolase of the HAD superfamily
VKIQAVFFDMGGTIETYRHDSQMRVANAPAIRKVLVRNHIDLALDDTRLAAFVSKGFSDYKRWSVTGMVELPPRMIWSQFIFKDDKILDMLSAAAAEELTFLYETKFHERSLRPEVPEMLENLKRMGLKIGCISNVASRKQVPNNLKKYGIIQYFDPIVLSSEYGRRKPDPAIFHYAASLANLPTDTCAYVGDRVSRDILGSKLAGYGMSIQVRHDFDAQEDGHEMDPDYFLQDLKSVPDIIRKEKRNRSPTARIKRRYTVIFFDAGDILYHRPEKRKTLNRFLKKKGIAPELIDETRRLKLIDAAYQGKLGRHECYRRVLNLYGIQSAEDIAIGMQAMEEDDKSVEIMPEVPETLHALKRKGFRLGIITDTALPISIKLGWFRQAGFGDVWSTITSSKELGYRKPDPKIYLSALEQAQVTIGQAVFVGHKTSELDGARRVGMTTVAYNYDKDARADYYIERFSELVDLSILK